MSGCVADPAKAPVASAAAAPTRAIQPLWVRVTHWINAFAMVLMIIKQVWVPRQDRQ